VCHQSVWCDGCPKGAGSSLGLLGPRFKCLVCANVDLCKECFVGDKGPPEHSASHHMLVYPTPAPEVLQTFAFPGLKCAYCAREGFAGSAYTCAACPPPAAGVSTSVWCESCAWQRRAAGGAQAQGSGATLLTRFSAHTCAPRNAAPILLRAGELQALHVKSHPRIKRVPLTPVQAAADKK